MRRLSIAKCAYLAGFFDGEAALTLIYRQLHTFNLYIGVGNNNFVVIKHIHQLIGGSLVRTFTVKHKRAYRLQFKRKEIEFFLPQVLPYLVIKKKIARLLLQYLKITNPNCRNDTYFPLRLSICHEVCKLNRLGRGRR